MNATTQEVRPNYCDSCAIRNRVDAAEAVERALDDLLRAVGIGDAVGADRRLAARSTNRVARFLRRSGRAALARKRHADIVDDHLSPVRRPTHREIGRAACRESGNHYVKNRGDAVTLKKQKNNK